MKDYDVYQKWVKQVREVKLPKWDELPNFDLYMEQVLSLLTRYTGPLGIDPITPAMINNYVKHGIIVTPVKKKYQVMQIADILIITLLKPLFSIEDIRVGINRITATEYPKQAFDHFIDMVNKKLNQLGDVSEEYNSKDQLTNRFMEITSTMLVDHLEATHLMKIIKQSKEHEPTPIK